YPAASERTVVGEPAPVAGRALTGRRVSTPAAVAAATAVRVTVRASSAAGAADAGSGRAACRPSDAVPVAVAARVAVCAPPASLNPTATAPQNVVDPVELHALVSVPPVELPYATTMFASLLLLTDLPSTLQPPVTEDVSGPPSSANTVRKNSLPAVSE